jgi:hypothetical protein
MFEVPSEIDLYFQALDKNYMALQRMRTHVEFQPGEFRGCVGCHETRTFSAISSSIKKRPVRPVPPPWGDCNLIDYEKMIQPIFDKKCVSCHGTNSPKGKLDLTAARDPYGYVQSYRSIYGLKPGDPTPNVDWTPNGDAKDVKVKVRGKITHPWWDIMFGGVIERKGRIIGKVNEVKQLGAIRHPFALHLVNNSEHVKRLTPDELQLIMTFFDLQVPYFATYRQMKGKDLIQVRVDPYPPFGKSRVHTIHHGVDVAKKANKD